MKKFFFLLTFILFQCVVFSQNHTLRGVVYDKETNERLSSANVLLYSRANKLLKFTTTDKEGTFLMDIVDGSVEKSYLKVSFIGYETMQREID